MPRKHIPGQTFGVDPTQTYLLQMHGESAGQNDPFHPPVSNLTPSHACSWSSVSTLNRLDEETGNQFFRVDKDEELADMIKSDTPDLEDEQCFATWPEFSRTRDYVERGDDCEYEDPEFDFELGRILKGLE